MRRFLKIAVPLLLAVLILLSISWYFFQYDTTFTRTALLQYARKMEDEGNHNFAVWLYDLAYEYCGDDDAVAIELAQQFKEIGNYTKAEYTLSKAIEDGGSVELYIALCQTYVEQNKLRDAVSMLDKVSDSQIRAQLETLRPAAPSASSPSGTYMQYITVELTSEDATVFVNKEEDYPSLLTDSYTGPITLDSGQTTLFAVSVNDSGLVSSLSVYHYMVGSVVEEVSFVDPSIEEAVREMLGVDDQYVIHSNQLWNFTDFTVPAEARSCEDLKWMPYLEQLAISGASFDSLEVLSSMSRLHTLTITDCSISASDMQVITSLPLLQKLTLRNCGLSNISALAQCVALTDLDLSENAIRDVSPLAALTNLKALSLRSNAVIHAEDISGLTGLTTLDLAYNSLTTTEPLSALTGLIHLDVSANALMKLEGLETLTMLENFAAANNNLIDINVLSSCLNLVSLDVSYNTLLSIDVAGQLPSLVELNFSHNEVSVLPKFSVDCALQIIDGSYNLLSSLDRLSKLENLRIIYMDYNSAISTVDTLQYCPVLAELHIYGTRVRDVSKLTTKGIFVQYTPI